MRFRLPQTLVYWAPSGASNYGRPSQATPAQYPCRWEDMVTETIDGNGDTVLSSSTVYLAVNLLVGGLVMEGTLAEAESSSFPANPKDDRRVKEIISKGRVPSLKGNQSLTTLQLK